MDLTPVKIRGKKRPAIDQGQRTTTTVNSLKYYSPEAHNFVNVSATPATPPRTDCQQSDGRRPLSTFEVLPAELLEEIFHHCSDHDGSILNFLRCSPIIGRKLSSDRIKYCFLQRTCSVGKDETCFDNTKQLAPFQSEILNLRWMTLPFLRRSIPNYMTQTIAREFRERDLHWPTDKLLEPTIGEYIEALFPPYVTEVQPYHEIHWIEPDDRREIILCLGPLDGVVGLKIIDRAATFDPDEESSRCKGNTYKWRLLSFEQGTRIPDKLLRGPWTSEKCQFLDIVIRANASIDWDHTTAGETAHEGFTEALRTGNLQAIRTLLVRRHPQILPGEHSGFFDDEEFHNSHVGIVPETRHLRFAVVELGCPHDIVEALLFAPELKVDAGDVEVWDWVHKRKFYEDETAAWLERGLLWLKDRQMMQRMSLPASERNQWFFPQTRV